MYIIIKWQVFSGWESNNFSPLMLLQLKLPNGRNETNISFNVWFTVMIITWE